MNMTKKTLAAVIILLLILIAVFIFISFTDIGAKVTNTPFDSVSTNENATMSSQKKNKNDIIFSDNDYFYKDDIKLSLSTKNKDITEIFYTLDSTPPDSENGIIYNEPIKLKGTSSLNVKSYTVKACGKKSDGTFTDVYTHSYFISEKIDERFDVLVFSLSTDPYNLYDYDNGIFVPGKLRDDYINETGDKEPDPPAPANYNMRGVLSERPVYVELIDSDGSLLLSQNAGMRTFGGWSRAMEQKSIKLFARSEYEENKNLFDYSFFPDNSDYSGMAVTKYKQIILRNNANDNPFGFLRDETIQSIAELTTLEDTQSSRPAAVFLNGEYYGFVWIKEPYDDNYFDDMNGIKDGEWAILGGGENWKDNDDTDTFTQTAVSEYENMYSLCEMDLTDDDIFNQLESQMDLENFLTYYAVQIYVANGDWPRGNYKVYKYYGDTSLSPYQNNTADGKWRWLLFDTDFGLGLYDCPPTDKTLGILLGKYGNEEDKYSPLLEALLKRDDVKERFVRIMCDLMNYQFSPKSIMDHVHQKESERKQEVSFNIKYGGVMLKDTWSSMNYVNDQVKSIVKFGTYRPEEMKKQIIQYLDVDRSGFYVNVPKNEHADIKINSCIIDENGWDFEGFYYDINTVEVKASIDAGYDFSHWLVNGKEVSSSVLTLTSADAINEKIKIELVVSQSEFNIPVITIIDYETDSDYIELYNPYSNDIDLKKLYISDDNENLYKQPIAYHTLRSGEKIRIYCKNYKLLDALGGYALGFNLKNGETIYISDKNNAPLKTIYLPNITNDYVYKFNLRTGNYTDVLRDSVDQ